MSHDKIRICHATAAVSNPYTMPKVDMASVDEWGNADLNGHGLHGGVPFATTMVQGDHWGDIIPPFTYTYTVKEGKGQDKVEVTKTVVFGGLNWSDAGKAIYDNGCQPTTPPPPPPPPEKCPPDSANQVTVLDGKYDPAKDYETCYVTPPPPVVPPITPEQATVIDAAVAAMPQPATVALPAPATVPSKGPILPAAVPAGDGSSAPVLPVTALALLVLASTALAASTVRLVGAKR